MDLVSAQPINGNSQIVHPAQVLNANGNFVGWGTVKGAGVSNCPDYFGTRWQIYFDGREGFDYFCEQHYGDVSDTAQNQLFRIEYTTCPGDGLPKFVVYWNGAWKSCKAIAVSGGEPAAGSESIGTTSTQNLRVHYSAIRAKSSTAGWQYFTQLNECETDPPYYVDRQGLSIWSIAQ